MGQTTEMQIDSSLTSTMPRVATNSPQQAHVFSNNYQTATHVIQRPIEPSNQLGASENNLQSQQIIRREEQNSHRQSGQQPQDDHGRQKEGQTSLSKPIPLQQQMAQQHYGIANAAQHAVATLSAAFSAVQASAAAPKSMPTGDAKTSERGGSTTNNSQSSKKSEKETLFGMKVVDSYMGTLQAYQNLLNNREPFLLVI